MSLSLDFDRIQIQDHAFIGKKPPTQPLLGLAGLLQS